MIKKRNKMQHMKIVLNIIITLVIVTTFASLYINYKNGFSMDSIVMSMVDALKWIIPSGFCKSFMETKEEKKMRLEYLKAGLKDEYENRE